MNPKRKVLIYQGLALITHMLVFNPYLFICLGNKDAITFS